jgi:teichoic acid transport system ATP-binding protein
VTEEEQAKIDAGTRPTIIVDDVHVRYRTFASGKPVSQEGNNLTARRTRGIREVHALKGVSFIAFQGESIGVIGHNGSGKSTMLRTIAGLTPAASGAVFAEDQPALLGVNAALLNELSGDKNVRLGGLALGFTKAEMREKYETIVEFAGLEEFIEFPMRTYSSGMSARLRFAIAASKNHSILLIDEALSVGDKKFRNKSKERIGQMREAAGTVMLVSHSISTVLETCSRVLWIDKGNLRMNGDPQEVCDAYLEQANG